jgi:hypothetical protein
MDTDALCENKALTSEQMFSLLASLPEDDCVEHDKSKRRCSRWRLTAPAEFRFTSDANAPVTEYADVRDISLMGIGMVCRAPVPLETRGLLVLPLEDGCYYVDVKVVHCTAAPEGYRVGCQLLLPDLPAMPAFDPDAIPDDDTEITGL